MDLNPAGDQVADVVSEESRDEMDDILGHAELEYFLPEMRRNIGRPGDPAVINLPWTKAFTRDDLFVQFFGTVARHPRDYMATLVRLGFEPLPGKETTSLLSNEPKLRLPGLFSYLGYIIRTDGIFGIFRGLHYNLAYTLVHNFVYKNVNNLAIENIPRFAAAENPENAFTSFADFKWNLAREIGARIVATTVAYPLKMIAIRSMAQFVGGERIYDTFFGAISDLYQSGGVGDFYSGIVPIFIAEALVVTARWTVYYFFRDKLDRGSRSTILIASGLLADSATNPFRTVATVMACNGPNCSLAAANFTGPTYSTWLKCLFSLWAEGEANRGGSLIWRTRSLPKQISIGQFYDIAPRHD